MWKVTFEPANEDRTIMMSFDTQAEALAAYEAASVVKRDGRLALEAPDAREVLTHLCTIG